MTYELHNWNRHAVECTLPPHGQILIPAGGYLPSPEQEAKGLNWEIFETFTPSLLRPTAPAVRRRLLESEGLPVPEDIITATAHLDEFRGKEGPGSSDSVPAVVPTTLSDDEVAVITDEGVKVMKKADLGTAPPAPPPAVDKKVDTSKLAAKLDQEGRSSNLDGSMQTLADALSSSSGKGPITNPD